MITRRKFKQLPTPLLLGLAIVLFLFFPAAAQQAPNSDQLAFMEEPDCKKAWNELVNFMKTPDRVITDSLVSWTLAKAEKCPEIRTLYLAELTSIYRDQGRHKAIIKLGESLLNNNELTCFEDSVRVLGNLHGAYTYLQIPHKVIEILKVIDQLDRIKTEGHWGDYYPDEIELLQTTGQYQKVIALTQKKKRKLLSRPNITDDNWYLIANYYNNLGVYYNQWGKPDTAIIYFDSCLTITGKLKRNWRFLQALTTGNKGSSYRLKGQYAEAIPLLRMDADVSKKEGHMWNSVNSWLEMAECFRKLNMVDSARIFTLQCEHYLAMEGTIQMWMHYYTNKSWVLGKLGQFEDANKLLQMRQQLVDSSNLAKRQNQLLAMQVMYEVEQTNKALHSAQLEVNEQQLKVERERTNVFLLLAGLGGLTLLVVLTIIQVRRVRKREAEVRILHTKTIEQKGTIEASLHEKEALLKEIHHRVKNNLQVISGLLQLQANRSENLEVKEVMADGQARIQSMAMVHQMLYQNADYASVPFTTYLEKLTALIEAGNRKQRDIQLHIHSADVVLPPDLAIPLGLIVNELVTNTYKHAFPNGNGIIHISLKMLPDGRFQLEVGDNGTGLPDGFDFWKARSTGLRLVGVLVQQIKAKLHITGEKGTQYSLVFENN